MGQKEHPANRWQEVASHPGTPFSVRLRLAAMAGHMQTDALAARRAALIEVLLDGRPHVREELYAQIADQVGENCWGKRPREALQRDLWALRAGGLRIAYSRRPGIEGYYLQHPPLDRPEQERFETTNRDPAIRDHTEGLRQLSPAEKNQIAFAAADFALRQKRLILTEQHPNWSTERVEQESRKMVYGTPPAGAGQDG